MKTNQMEILPVGRLKLESWLDNSDQSEEFVQVYPGGNELDTPTIKFFNRIENVYFLKWKTV